MARRKGISVTVYRAGSKGTPVALTAGSTVADAIKAADLNLKSSEIVQVNGTEVDRDELSELTVDDGDRIILVKNVQGGC